MGLHRGHFHGAADCAWPSGWSLVLALGGAVIPGAMVAGLAFGMSAPPCHCDPSLPQILDSPYGYRERGDRCEGTYIKEVTLTTLVASFTESFGAYDLHSNDPLTIAWDHTAKGAVRLQARALRRRTHFRMDTCADSGAGLFVWPIDLLAALNIPEDELGIVGTLAYSIGGFTGEVYLPLRVHQRRSPDRHSDKYRIVLVPSVELREVFVTIGLVGNDGRPGTIIQDGVPLRYGYYPANRALEILVAKPAKSGLYFVEIGTLFRTEGSGVTRLWFLNSKS
jgi:hypothetical protein